MTFMFGRAAQKTARPNLFQPALTGKAGQAFQVSSDFSLISATSKT
jgi:hypothetical protein